MASIPKLHGFDRPSVVSLQSIHANKCQFRPKMLRFYAFSGTTNWSSGEFMMFEEERKLTEF